MHVRASVSERITNNRVYIFRKAWKAEGKACTYQCSKLHKTSPILGENQFNAESNRYNSENCVATDTRARWGREKLLEQSYPVNTFYCDDIT